jgi:hypothetical protein
MSMPRLVELVVALAILAASIWLYRRRDPSAGGGYGNQGAVLLLVVGAIMLIHAIGLLDYRPSPSEFERMRHQ